MSPSPTIEPNSWTNTWSGVLAAWTIDRDGSVLNLNGSDAGNGMSSGEKTGIAVGTILGTFLVSTLALLSIKVCRRSYQRRKQNRLDMQEEDTLAYSIEARELEKERLLPAVNEESEFVDEASESIHSVHQIPRKPIPVRQRSSEMQL